jgi:hypothetical protein
MASDFLAACEKKNLALTERRMTPARRVSLATEIGERQGELRAVHLKYHLTTADLLSESSTTWMKRTDALLRH